MVSSRRLAREWALKILYQIDVGKSTLGEACDAALERLRREFVQRGSRTASGSNAEEICLDYVTSQLKDLLPNLRLPLERALTTGIGRVFHELPYWQEVRFERSFRSRAPGVPLDPPRLLAPLPDVLLFPDATMPSDGLAMHLAGLTVDERARYATVILKVREHLPNLLDPEMKKIGLAFARDVAATRPLSASPDALQEWLHTRRHDFNDENEERWHKVGVTVQKQTGDWLRTATFTDRLVHGTYEQITTIDRALSELASGWKLERQVAVDRNILRLAGFEMLFMPGIPTGASINEAVELAKKFSTAESGRFVNGVLGALAAQVPEKPATAVEESETLETEDQELDIPDIADIEESDIV